MALQQQKRTKSQQVSTEGPSMQADGLPPNPSDQIYQGRPLPIVRTGDHIQRRPFSEITKSPRYWREGCGPDMPADVADEHKY